MNSSDGRWDLETRRASWAYGPYVDLNLVLKFLFAIQVLMGINSSSSTISSIPYQAKQQRTVKFLDSGSVQAVELQKTKVRSWGFCFGGGSGFTLWFHSFSKKRREF